MKNLRVFWKITLVLFVALGPEARQDLRGVETNGSAFQEVVFNVRNYGAKGDGVTVDSDAINHAVAAAAKAGSGKVYFPAGVYLVGAPIKILSGINYVGLGRASVIRKSVTTTDNIFGDDTLDQANITISDLEIDGNNAAVAFDRDDAKGNAIRFNRVSRSRILRCYIHDTVFNGISVYNSSNDNLIQDCILSRIGKSGTPPKASSFNGIFLEFGVNNNVVERCLVADARAHGIWSTCQGADSYDNCLRQNVISNAGGDGIRIGDEFGSSTQHHTLITANKVIACAECGIRIFEAVSGRQERTTILSNFVIKSRYGLLVQGTAKSIVGSIVAHNEFLQNDRFGVLIDDAAQDSVLAENICSLNGTDLRDSRTASRKP